MNYNNNKISKITANLIEYYTSSKSVLQGKLVWGDKSYYNNEETSRFVIRDCIAGGNLRGGFLQIREKLIDFLLSDNLLKSGIYRQSFEETRVQNACEKYLNQYGFSENGNHELLYTTSTLNIINGLFLAISRKNWEDSIMVFTPFYFHITSLCEINSLNIVPVISSTEKSLKISKNDLDLQIQKAKKERLNIKSVLITNPTFSGEIYSIEEIQDILSLLKKKIPEVLIIEDAALSSPSIKYNLFSLYAGSFNISNISLFTLGKACCLPELTFSFCRIDEKNDVNYIPKLSKYVAQYFDTTSSEFSRILKFASIQVLEDIPYKFILENQEEYKRRLSLIINKFIPLLNLEISSQLIKRLSNKETLKIQQEFDKLGIAKDYNRLKEYEWVKPRATPICGRDIILDFKGCALLTEEELSKNISSSVFLTKDIPLDTSLHIVSFLLGENNNKGVALSPCWSMGLTESQNRYLIRMSVGQLAYSESYEINKNKSDELLDEVFRIICEKLVTLFINQ